MALLVGFLYSGIILSVKMARSARLQMQRKDCMAFQLCSSWLPARSSNLHSNMDCSQ